MPTSTPPAAARLLLIDDSVADLQLLLHMLASRNWRTTVAFDGLDGYRKACLAPPDLILLDVRMPKMDGFATCRRLKAEPVTAQIPLIFLTAAEDKEDRLTGLGLGAVDYIVKPFASEEEVLARIGIHLQLARRQLGASTSPGFECDNHPPLVRAAIRLLMDNIADPPDAVTLAQQLGTNKKRLNEAFHAAVAMPVFGWVREQRLGLARQLLANTDTPVADIAQHLGYRSAANFSTAFRERFDCTPREYRQRRRQAAGEALDDED